MLDKMYQRDLRILSMLSKPTDEMVRWTIGFFEVQRNVASGDLLSRTNQEGWNATLHFFGQYN